MLLLLILPIQHEVTQLKVKSGAMAPQNVFFRDDDSPVDWCITDGLTPYAEAVAIMEARVAAISAGTARELVWLVEHPPLYTAGTSAKAADLLSADFPVFETGRGGEHTYHGPGQRVAYVMLDLKRRNPDVRAYVKTLEQWLINTLAHFGVRGMVREGRIGVWVEKPDGSEAKIAALGIRLRKWVSYHGISLNLNPHLEHFSGIVPCGIREYGVTSLADLGVNAKINELDQTLKIEFEKLING